MCTNIYLDLIKLANLRRHIIKSNWLKDAEKGNIWEQIIAVI